MQSFVKGNTPENSPFKTSDSPKSYTVRQTCSFCDSANVFPVMDFGHVALAGGFLRQDQFEAEEKFPLRLSFCANCFAVQIMDVVPAETLFKNYFYFSSAIGTLREHFEDYATEVVSRFLPEPAKSTVVEIGCNDGILLRPFADQEVGKLIGVDPATNVVNTINDTRITVVNDFFSEQTAEDIKQTHGEADLIVANNVFAHIPEINDLTSGIEKLLGQDGIFIFEVHYLGKVLHGLQYDMVYHEHLYYYSLLALSNHFKRFGMLVFDVKAIPIHAGSMRYYVCKKDSKHASQVSSRVEKLKQAELAAGLNKAETYAKFAQSVDSRRDSLLDLLEKIKAKGKSIGGYGASGRANTIIQYTGITDRHVDYVIDDAPAKQGFYTPGSHLLIRDNSVLTSEPPDYLLNFAWGYLSEIAEKCRPYFDNGGRMILPLPDVRVLFHPNETEI
ncbi:MAG: class I SAM-dependent methyltransferase [Candidatus Obscuribacter sp.]|nr:class I SAM-dependent methyltransferase [Candidatus Obscuribacter sp.]